MTHDYVRQGTTSPFAAYDIGTGSVFAHAASREASPGLILVDNDYHSC